MSSTRSEPGGIRKPFWAVRARLSRVISGLVASTEDGDERPFRFDDPQSNETDVESCSDIDVDFMTVAATRRAIIRANRLPDRLVVKRRGRPGVRDGWIPSRVTAMDVERQAQLRRRLLALPAEEGGMTTNVCKRSSQRPQAKVPEEKRACFDKEVITETELLYDRHLDLAGGTNKEEENVAGAKVKPLNKVGEVQEENANDGKSSESRYERTSSSRASFEKPRLQLMNAGNNQTRKIDKGKSCLGHEVDHGERFVRTGDRNCSQGEGNNLQFSEHGFNKKKWQSLSVDDPKTLCLGEEDILSKLPAIEEEKLVLSSDGFSSEENGSSRTPNVSRSAYALATAFWKERENRQSFQPLKRDFPGYLATSSSTAFRSNEHNLSHAAPTGGHDRDPAENSKKLLKYPVVVASTSHEQPTLESTTQPCFSNLDTIYKAPTEEESLQDFVEEDEEVVRWDI